MLNSAIIHWVFRYASGVVPTVAISNVTSISYTSATVTGNVTAAGSSAVTERGICYGTSYDPTITGTKAISGSGTGSFSANLTGLTAGTTYYVRAYATNTAGTGYSTNATFTTTAISVPSVTTVSVGTITSNSAIVTGNATAENGSSITERGICWNSTGNPTIANSRSSAGPGTGSIAITIGSLSANTTYYARAYATNSAGTGYGTTLSFTTAAAVTVPTVTTGTASSVTSNSADVSGNVTATGGATVTERGICYGTSANPTVSGTHVASGSGTGSFTASLTGLTASTTYYVRAYATNSAGTAYGTQTSFATSAAPASDVPFEDGMTYINEHYPNQIKTMCLNYSVNDDGLAYVLIEPVGTSASTGSKTKTLVLIHKDNGVISEQTITAAYSAAGNSAPVCGPFAYEGFFGFTTRGTSKNGVVNVFKVNTSTGALEHVGSSSAWTTTLTTGNYVGGGNLSCYTFNGKRYMQQTGLGGSSVQTQNVTCLDNSGSASTYWSPTIARQEISGKRIWATTITADPNSQKAIFLGGSQNSGTSLAASDRISLWRDTKVQPTGINANGTNYSTSVQLLASTSSGSYYGYNLLYNNFNPQANPGEYLMMPVLDSRTDTENVWCIIPHSGNTGFYKIEFVDGSGNDISYTDLINASQNSIRIKSITDRYPCSYYSTRMGAIGLFFLPVYHNGTWKLWTTDSNYNAMFVDLITT